MHYGGMHGGMRSFDEGATKMDELNCELWHACAGPLTQLPPVDSLVMYWPQGHIEQVRPCASSLPRRKDYLLNPCTCRTPGPGLVGDP